MSISPIGPQVSAPGLFDAAANDLSSAAQSLATPAAGSSSDLGVGEQFEDAQSSQNLGDAVYGFDGRVLADQRNAAAQLFSALA